MNDDSGEPDAKLRLQMDTPGMLFILLLVAETFVVQETMSDAGLMVQVEWLRGGRSWLLGQFRWSDGEATWIDESDTIDADDSEESDDDPAIVDQFLPASLRGKVHTFGGLSALGDEQFTELELHLAHIHGDFLRSLIQIAGCGWRTVIKPVRSPSGDVAVEVSAAPPTAIEPHSAAKVWRTRDSDPGHIRIRWAYQDGRWSFDETRTGIDTAGGEHAAHPVESLMMLAEQLAPGWAFTQMMDRPGGWHSEGSAEPASALPVRPLGKESEPGPELVARRSAALRDWADEHRFGDPQPAREKVLRTALAGLGVGFAGYYLLEFTDGQCYVGQSTDLPKRVGAEHPRTYTDIKYARLLPDPAASCLEQPWRRRHLLAREQELIHSIQQVDTLARNKSEMAVISGSNVDLDHLVDVWEQERWLTTPDVCNAEDGWHTRHLDPDEFAGGAHSYATLLRTYPNHSAQLARIIGHYLARCIPFPARTEHRYWSLSCLPSGGSKEWARVACVTVSWTETLTLIQHRKTRRLAGFIQVNDLELFADGVTDSNYVEFLRRHPGIYDTPADYRQAGPWNALLWAVDLDALERLLDDTTVARAAATAALHIMRKGKTPASISNAHCPQLVTASVNR